jgi:surfeit locus 1 family protein
MTRRMVAPLIFGVLGVALLVSLGLWQVQRLAWKTAILAEIDAKLAAAPVAVPAEPDPAADQYLRVRAEGEIEPGEIHVFTAAPGGGAGYRVIVPLRLADGRRILLDRGLVREREKDAARRLGPIAVEGALLWPREADRFTSPPDREKNVWYARDTPLMAGALGTLPVLLVASASDDPGQPLPMPVTVDIPNNHLGYAIQWFGLAAVWALMTGYLLWRIKRRID